MSKIAQVVQDIETHFSTLIVNGYTNKYEGVTLADQTTKFIEARIRFISPEKTQFGLGEKTRGIVFVEINSPKGTPLSNLYQTAGEVVEHFVDKKVGTQQVAFQVARPDVDTATGNAIVQVPFIAYEA